MRLRLKTQPGIIFTFKHVWFWRTAFYWFFLTCYNSKCSLCVYIVLSMWGPHLIGWRFSSRSITAKKKKKKKKKPKQLLNDRLLGVKATVALKVHVLKYCVFLCVFSLYSIFFSWMLLLSFCLCWTVSAAIIYNTNHQFEAIWGFWILDWILMQSKQQKSSNKHCSVMWMWWPAWLCLTLKMCFDWTWSQCWRWRDYISSQCKEAKRWLNYENETLVQLRTWNLACSVWPPSMLTY